MIEISNLTFGYSKKKTLFKNLNLDLQMGHIYGLLGKNGAGKSTLLKNLAGLVFPQEGLCKVNGYDTSERSPRLLQELFFIPEELHLPAVTASRFAESTGHFYPKFDMNQYYAMLSEFNVPINSFLNKLSFGQQKKVMIAFGLASNTALLIMDEPTNGLDIPSKVQFRKIMASALTEERCMVISTHQVRDLDSLIDSLLVLHQEEIVINRSLDDIAERIQFTNAAQANKEAENYKTYLMSAAVLAGMLAVVIGLGAYLSDGKLSFSIQFAVFVNFFLIAGCVFTSMMFSDLGDKKKSIPVLMLPASLFEKYLVAWIYSFVVFQLVMLCCFYSIDYLILNAVKKATEEVKMINVFSTEPRYWLVFVFFAVLHSISLLGAIFFEKMHFIKTAFAFFVFLGFIILISNKMMSSLLDVEIMQSIPLGRLVIKEGGKEFLINPPLSSETIVFYASILVIIVLWTGTYFKENEAIYLQIAAYVAENIMLGKWPIDQKIPSVRDLAVELQVNPNTVVRAYEFLQNKEVITNKRGIGFFIETDAEAKIKAYSKERFLNQELPEFFRNIYLLNISMKEIEVRFEAFKKENY
eukprot:gene12722-14931_t